MKYKYFKRYLISSSILLSLIFSLLIIVGYFNIKSNMHHDEQLDYINQFEKIQKDIETSLNISVALGQLLTESDAITTYAAENAAYDYLDFQNISTIVNILNSNQTTFANLILNISLFKERDSMVLNSTGTIDTEEFYAKTGIQTEEIIDIFSENTVSGYSYEILSRGSENNIIYLAGQKIYANASKIYLCISVSQPGVSYIPDFYGKKSLLISGNYTENTISHIVQKAEDINANGVYKEELNNGTSNLIYSVLNNMPNIILASEFQYTTHTILFLLFLLSLFLGLALSVLCSFKISRWIYKPIQNLMNILAGSNTINEENDEVAFLVDSASQMVETNRTLTLELDKQQNLIRDKFVFDLLNGFVWGDAIEQNIKACGLNFLKEPCVVVLFEGRAHLGLSVQFPKQNLQSPQTSVIFNTIKKILIGNTVGIGIIIDNNQNLFILPAKPDNKQAVLNAINAVREKADVSLKAAISTEIRNIEQYKYIYFTLSSMLEQQYMLADFDILVMDEKNGKAANEGNYSIEEEQRLTEYLLSNESEKALLFLNQILTRTFQANLSKVELSSFRILMLNSIQRLLYIINKTPEDLFPEKDMLKKLESCEDNETFRISIIWVFRQIAHAIQQNVIQRHTEIVDEILKYIQENLDKDLSMDDICNKFGMSASTVARRLKERNINFKSYINDQRIKKAKELMHAHPDWMVKDIAQMTGFNNIVSFNRLFKKYEAISPGQYMENLKLKPKGS